MFTLPTTLIGWLLLAGLIAIITITAMSFPLIVAFAKAQGNAKVFEFLRAKAYNFVATLEQDPTLNGLASDEKKQQAMLWLVTAADKYHFPLSEDDASNLIEEAVYLVKNVGLKRLEDTLAHPVMIAK